MNESIDFVDELDIIETPDNSIFNNYTNPAQNISESGLKQVNTFIPGEFANPTPKAEEKIEEIKEIEEVKEVEEVKETNDDKLNVAVMNSLVDNTPVNEEVSSSNDTTSNDLGLNTNQLNGMPSMIKMYGEVITDKKYITNPAIARDEEINRMILAILTPDKSALLVGKPGIGKTALVEGLSYRIGINAVPAAIQGWKIIKINIPALLGKMNVNGVEVSKLQLLIDELDNVEKTILFIDEVHLLVSKNGGTVDLDFANMLKPYLDRGRIMMIGATTSEEYEAYILRDRAFVRRFMKIDIAELQGDNVVKVLLGTVPKFEQKMGIKMAYTEFQQERLYQWIVKHTVEENRIYEVQNRYPDICLTVISSAFSYAMFEGVEAVRIKHFYLAMKNTNTIYPDRITKAIEDFKVTFAQWLIQEGIDPKLI